MSKTHVGIDVLKETLDIHVEVNGKVKHRVFANADHGFRDILVWLRKFGVENAHLCMEATGPYWERLAVYMHKANVAVSVVNAHCIKSFAESKLKRAKTDKVDAGVICHFAKAMEPALWNPPPPEVRTLQSLSRRLYDLVRMRRQELNRLDVEPDKAVQQSIKAVVRTIETQIKKMREKIKTLIAAHKHLRDKQKLLLTIPGVGNETVHLLLSEIPNIELFAGPKQLVAFAGVAPKEKKSGTSVRGRVVLSKSGNSRIRAGLYMAALSAMKWNPVVREFCERLAERGKPPMKIIAAAMRKILHIIYGVLNSRKPFRADLAAA